MFAGVRRAPPASGTTVPSGQARSIIQEEQMLKIGNMDNARVDRLGALAAHVVEHALASGLNWDEAILAFGIAAKALAAKASDQGVGTIQQCTQHAERRLKSGMDQSADVLRAYLS
jgi:hypothetical protein